MWTRSLSTIAATGMAFCFSAGAVQANTSVNIVGEIAGASRCLTGNSDGSAGQTCGGDTSSPYFGALSITEIYSQSVFPITLTRVADDSDRIWRTQNANTAIQVRPWAGYSGTVNPLPMTGTASVGAHAFTPFPTNPSGTLAAANDRVVSAAVGDVMEADYLARPNGFFFGLDGFITVPVGTTPFELVFQSGGQFLTSNNVAGSPWSNASSDHMVTYRAVVEFDDGADIGLIETRYLIGFAGADSADFQDVVWEVRLADPIPVPEPGTAGYLIVGGLLGFAVLRKMG